MQGASRPVPAAIEVAEHWVLITKGAGGEISPDIGSSGPTLPRPWTQSNGCCRSPYGTWWPEGGGSRKCDARNTLSNIVPLHPGQGGVPVDEGDHNGGPGEHCAGAADHDIGLRVGVGQGTGSVVETERKNDVGHEHVWGHEYPQHA